MRESDIEPDPNQVVKEIPKPKANIDNFDQIQSNLKTACETLSETGDTLLKAKTNVADFFSKQLVCNAQEARCVNNIG